MNWRRYLGALMVATATACAVDIVINAILLRQVFIDAAHLWLSPDELNRRVPLGLAALVGTMAFAGLAFIRTGRRGVCAGLEFGTWLALAASAGVIGLLSLVPWPTTLVAAIAGQQMINSVILGATFGAIYRDSRQR